MGETFADIAPDAHQRNAELAAPMVRLRAIIAGRWERVSDLLRDLGIREKSNLTEKIFASEATSDHIRSEIKRILAHELPERAKAGELVTLLAETEADASAIQEQRNLLQSKNGGIVGAFFKRQKFADYYADKLDLETRKSLAEEGLLRAADTFDPSIGGLSTYAFLWMKAYIQRAGTGDRKHTRDSLDREFGRKKGGEAANLLALTEDHRAEQPYAAGQRRELIAVLRGVMAEMPIQWRRSLELLSGLTTDHRTYTTKEAADIMNGEGLRTIEKQVAVTPMKAADWAKQARRRIVQKMGPLFAKKDGEE